MAGEPSNRCIVILGTGGHAQALKDHLVPVDALVRATDRDDDVLTGEEVMIGLGNIADRRRLFALHREKIRWAGRQIMKGAIVYDSAELGENVLINTGAQIDHDCIVGDHCVVGPGAILCGGVRLGEACGIGAGAVILQGVSLDEGTMVPAGSLVCGPDDFRKPVRMVRRDGADLVDVDAVGWTSVGSRRIVG